MKCLYTVCATYEMLFRQADSEGHTAVFFLVEPTWLYDCCHRDSVKVNNLIVML